MSTLGSLTIQILKIFLDTVSTLTIKIMKIFLEARGNPNYNMVFGVDLVFNLSQLIRQYVNPKRARNGSFGSNDVVKPIGWI